jgi:hypothetical protein
MRFVLNLLNFVTFFLAAAIVLNSPLIVAGVLARKRFDRRYIRGALAVGFAASTGYWLWRMDWFDVWRYGVPSIGLLLGYLPYIIGVGFVGWLLGGLIARGARPSRATTN